MFFFAGISLFGMDGPGYADADGVERDHGRGKDAHVQGVRSGETIAAREENNEDRVTKIFPHETGGDHPHERQEKIRIGISKIRPMPRTMLRNSDVYSPMVIIGWNCRPK